MNVKFPNYRKYTNREHSIKVAKAAENICMKLSIAILADVFGFGDKRIHRFMESYEQLADSIGIGTDTVEDIEKEIKRRFNI